MIEHQNEWPRHCRRCHGVSWQRKYETGCQNCIQKIWQSANVKGYDKIALDVAKTAMDCERGVPLEPEDILEDDVPENEHDCPDSSDSEDTDTHPCAPDDVEMAMLVFKDTTKVKKMVRKIFIESVP